ncbi:MAG: hypothetical protein M3P06_21285 [Acidobacteriota bacterium]|nr:hypothetical protein [Acidobacteriota bacterium]
MTSGIIGVTSGWNSAWISRDGASRPAAKHDPNRFIPLLNRDATYCRVGVGRIEDSNEIGQMNLVLYPNALAGSNTGGIAEGGAKVTGECELTNRMDRGYLEWQGRHEVW